MLKKSIGVGLLCLTGQAYANIPVTITDDIVKDDQECSIREAVEYVNKYLTAQPGESSDQKEAREKIRKSGYYGCGGENATANIILKAEETYLIDNAKNSNQEIQLKSAVTFQTETDGFSNDTKKLGVNNATIKAAGQHRLFNIDDGKAEINKISVKFTQVNLEGCGLSTICADKGGIIFNREALTLEYATVFNGYANEGGAIYSDGLIAGDNENSASSVAITSSILKNNNAKQGAFLFMGQPLFSINSSVIRDNKASDANGVVVYSANAFNDATTGTDNFTYRAVLANSSVFKNTGYLINLRDGVYVNNVTAVDNSRGLYFDAPNGVAHLSNSIVVNRADDCTYSSEDDSLSLNNLVGSSSCHAGESGNLNTYLSTVKYNKLFAGSSSEGSCDRPPKDGLLCPFYTPKDTFLGYFKPRLLSAYKTLNDSPIVNRGRMYSDGSNQGIYSCESKDQRGLTRSESVNCDLGAVELVISSDTVSRVGADIQYGQRAEMTIADSLADGELLPADECQAILGAASQYGLSQWTVGCLRLEQSTVTPKSKGKMTLDETGELVYTPDSNWHGLDEFNLRVITTASRFSDSENDRDIVIPVRVVQSPPNDFKNDKVKVSGGALGWLSVFGLLTLAFRRNKKA